MKNKKQYENILAEAGRLFLTHGYKDVSIRQIAKELSVSPGLIGYYFPTKRDIAVELFSRELKNFADLDEQYVGADDPILKSAVLIKLQITVLSSPVFKKLYMDALREDIILDVIRSSGRNIYDAVKEKYKLDIPDSCFLLNDLVSAGMERTLVLCSQELRLSGSVADLVFMIYMGNFYGSKKFLEEKCKESELVTARIICDHPEMLKDWL